MERPKVVIKPRTIPVEESSAVATQSAIFGGAKPVNTAVREREIEEKLKEAKEKEKSEKNSFSENPEGWIILLPFTLQLKFNSLIKIN